MSNILKSVLFFVIILYTNVICAQNIFTAVRTNQRYEVKYHKQIDKIEVNTTFYNANNTEKKKDIVYLNQEYRVIRQEGFNVEGKMIYNSLIEYKNDTLKTRTISNRKIPLFGNETQITLYNYDANNHLINVSKQNHKNELIEVINFENDEKGNPILLIINDGEYGYEKAKYDYVNNTYSTVVYNAKHELVSSSEGILLNRNNLNPNNRYNEFGDIIESKEYFYEYDYDKFGNWIKVYRFKKNGNKKVKMALVVRKITYQK